MKPPFHNFAAALLLAWAAPLVAAQADPPEKVGVNAAVNTDANGTPPGGSTRKLELGQEIVHNERVTTDQNGQTQILFLDGSSVSVGPNSDMTIDDFVYDPHSGTGKMTLTSLQGAMRFVGGKLSKQEDAVTMHMGAATIGVRGCVFLATRHPDGGYQVIFVYGHGLTVTSSNGQRTELYRPGFAVDVSSSGEIGPPHRAPPGSTSGVLTQLDGRTGGSGGATNIPNDGSVAKSNVPNTVSNNVQVSVQQADQNSSTTTTATTNTTPTNSPSQVPTSQVQVASSQSQPFVVNPNPPPPPPPTVVPISGAFKSTNSPPTAFGFNDSTNNGVYNGTITYPAGPTHQNGIVAGVAVHGGSGTLGPVTPGQTTAVTFSGSNGEVQTGTATMTPDGNFFYANLSGNSVGAGGPILSFIMGGSPVSQSFYAPTPTPQYLSFQVQPDAALANGAQAQTVPFLPAYAGGTMRNAVVSPFYVVAAANQQFGVYNPATNPTNQNPTTIAPKWLQASLAVNGQGPAQTAAFVVGMGSFGTSNDNNQVVLDGGIRGMVNLNATSPYTEIFAGAHSVPDATGNSLFGGNTLSGFVLDQNTTFLNNTFAPQLATAAQFGQTSTNYAYNQPVTAAGTFTPGTQSALNETGYFGGIMTHTTNPTAGSPYVLSGATVVLTDPVTGRVAATFAGADPFTAAQSGIRSMVLEFGSLPATDSRNYNRSIYIDNNTYAAAENPVIPSQINGTNLPTTTTVANPNTYAPGAAPPASGLNNLTPSLVMVTANTLGPNANSWMPAGVTPCTCQYLQWGYWSGQLLTPNAGLTASTRDDRSYINTWLAGQPTITMPTSGTGSFNGAAVGTVFNNGAAYLAAGNFSANYNFGSNTGAVNISNFDGANYTASVNGSGRIYAGTLTGVANRTGNVTGGFFGPNAIETGGNFGIQSTTGPRYIASGIFAGR